MESFINFSTEEQREYSTLPWIDKAFFFSQGVRKYSNSSFISTYIFRGKKWHILLVAWKKLIASSLNHYYVTEEETETHNIFKGSHKLAAFIDKWLTTNFIILARDGTAPQKRGAP